MTKQYGKATAVVALLLVIGFWAGAPFAGTQEAASTKLYQEIAGKYQFGFEGEYMTIAFWEKEGKLYGAPEGMEEVDYAEVTPVEIKELKFEATSNDGQYFEINFARGESGKIDKCVLISDGLEIEGTRIIE